MAIGEPHNWEHAQEAFAKKNIVECVSCVPSLGLPQMVGVSHEEIQLSVIHEPGVGGENWAHYRLALWPKKKTGDRRGSGTSQPIHVVVDREVPSNGRSGQNQCSWPSRSRAGFGHQRGCVGRQSIFEPNPIPSPSRLHAKIRSTFGSMAACSMQSAECIIAYRLQLPEVVTWIVNGLPWS